MHCTRRLLDRRSSSALAVALGLTAAAAGASCSSADGDPPAERSDAAEFDAARGDAPVDAAPGRDSGTDAALFDGGPRPVECASASCATSLVTTRGANASDLAEGFCALMHDGTVACWGAGAAGQLGRGEEAGAGDSPTAARVLGLQEIVSLDHTCAVDKNGAVFCWGTGPFLRSAVASTTTERAPVKLELPAARRVAVGIATGCALTEGGVLCWGANLNAQIAPLETIPSSAVLTPKSIEFPPGPALEEIIVGNATFVVRADRTVLSWGANPPLARVSSLFPDPYPLPSVVAGVSTIDLAEDNACAAASGVGYCWGMTPPTTLGTRHDEPRLERALPEPIRTPEPIVQIATTRTLTTTTPMQPQRWCAVGASGAVYCWGTNAGGQAGDGTKAFAYEAVRVASLPEPAAQVRTTPNATCALLTSGRVFCWGTNFYGQLGNGLLKVASVSPQEVVLP